MGGGVFVRVLVDWTTNSEEEEFMVGWSGDSSKEMGTWELIVLVGVGVGEWDKIFGLESVKRLGN